ncbi:MAG: hypothetical protein ABI348_00035 [Nitrososphaera sp.]
MGVMTWIVVGVVVLAVLGLGVRTFLSGVQQGVEKIAGAPGIRDVVAKTKQLVSYGEDQLKGSLEQQENALENNNHWERLPA